MLRVTVAPVTTPVSVADCKAHLVIEDSDQDRNIALYAKAAIGQVAKLTQWTLAPTTFEERFDNWPGSDHGRHHHHHGDIEISRHRAIYTLGAGPVRDVMSIQYLDANGALQTLDRASWDWERTDNAAHVWITTGISLPKLQDRPGAVRISFSAGFNDPYSSEGDDSLNLPDEVTQAVLLIVGDWFLNREDTSAGGAARIPNGAVLVCELCRTFR